jgi:hypothetical protein
MQMRGEAKPVGHRRFEDVDEEETEYYTSCEKDQFVKG